MPLPFLHRSLRAASLALLASCALAIAVPGCGNREQVWVPKSPHGRVERTAWEWQNPLPQGNPLWAVWADSLTGHVYAVGEAGTILDRTDQGIEIMSVPTDAALGSIFGIAGGRLVVAGGWSGTILRLEDGHWIDWPTPTTWNIGDLWMLSPQEGFAVGGNGTILRCVDGTWRSMGSPTRDRLDSVWAASMKDAYALCDKALFHFDGTLWTPVDLGCPDLTLYSVWGTSAIDVFVAGFTSCPDHARGVFHYDGTRWSFTPHIASGSFWGRGPRDVYSAGGGLVYHYDGASWAVIDNGCYLRSTDTGVTGLPPDTIFAVGGDAGLTSWNPGGCEQALSGSTLPFLDAWAASPSDVYAVGWGGVCHFDGSAWTWVQGLPWDAYSITGTGPEDITVGFYGFVYHFDGTTWTEEDVDPTLPNRLTAMSATPQGTVIAIERYDPHRAFRRDATGWSQLGGALADANLYDVWAASDDDVFAVGLNGTILHWDGSAWTPMSATIDSPLTDVFGFAPDDVYAAGTWYFLHYDGHAWARADSGLTINDLWGPSPNELFAVGPSGWIWHRSNGNGAQFRLVTSNYLYALAGTSGDDVFAVGDNGTILHYSTH